MKQVMVTGSSTGIGWATVSVLAGKGVHVCVGVRNEADAQRLVAVFGDRVTPLVFDVTDPEAVGRAAARVREALGGRTLYGLVNNAGIAVPGPLLHLSTDEIRHQLEVNVIGQITVIQAFAPLLGVDRALSGAPGRIVNISSISGKMARPFFGPYAASKHALEAISGSLRRELMLYGIDVVVVGPGAVVTPIWDKGKASTSGRFDDTDYAAASRAVQEFIEEMGRTGLPGERIGAVIWKALSTPRPRVRYAVVGRPILDWFVPRLLPARMVDRIIAKRLGLMQVDKLRT